MAGLNPVGLGLAPPATSSGGSNLAPAPRRSIALQPGGAFLPGSDDAADSSGVLIRISDEGLAASRRLGTSGESGLFPGELTEEQQREVQRLKQRDREVRQHEQAHVSAGGAYVRGGPRYEFTRGPDGARYATGGEVSIDVSAESTPEATLQKARVVKRAALAPAEPSPQDRRVAAQAAQLQRSARQELNKQQAEESGREIRGFEGQFGIDPANAPGGVQTLNFDRRA